MTTNNTTFTDNTDFLESEQSVASMVRQLHEYFKNCYSEYKIRRSNIVNQLEVATEAQEEALMTELKSVDAELTLYGVLSDSLSVADRVLHARSVMTSLGVNNEIYRIRRREEGE
ncbi:MAG TPA: hypothetical protein V6D10_25400 [Trichocoleus sp.]|jgi:hypothetical protein